jgi:signal transduction histidine kinase
MTFSPAADERPLVLVVDDDEDTRLNLRDILELDGYQVELAGSARELRQFNTWNALALVMLDRRLPDGSLQELIPEIHSHAPQAAIIVVTGYSDVDGAIAALRSGAADYLLKPINPDALRARIEQVVERKRAEQRYREAEKRALQAERLAAIGETMAALVHESRNALQRSKANLEMLMLEIEDRPEAIRLVARVQRAQEDLHRHFEEVRQWAAPIHPRLETCNLQELWREVWQQVKQAYGARNVTLVENIAEKSPVREVDPFLMSQVFRNILENAYEAAPEQTAVTIDCGKDRSGKGIVVAITDEGPGLSPEQERRICEPFFTTKTKGTGLGMAIAQRIVVAHRGSLSVSSPRGARIEIHLPR